MDARVAAALATIYLVWGSTYLAIRIMVEAVPPLLGTGVRFLVAGAAMYGGLVAWRGRGAVRAPAGEWAAAAVVGALILVGGIGLLTVGEQEVASGIAALVIGSVPLWVVVVRAVSGERVPRITLGAVVVGFAGLALLSAPGDRPEDAPVGWLAVIAAGAALTAVGSLLSPRLGQPRDALLAATLQMLTAGAILSAAGITAGETADLGELTARSLAALAYLVVVGSVVAYTVFVWLLASAPVSVVSTYAYVNPVVALALGWALLDEEVTATVVAGAAVVLGSVAFVVRGEAPRAWRTTRQER
jgi:drug/metabolite transporter (DMT)-like permease